MHMRFLGNNSLREFLIFAGILLFGFIFKTVLSRLLSRILYRLVNRFTDGRKQPATILSACSYSRSRCCFSWCSFTSLSWCWTTR